MHREGRDLTLVKEMIPRLERLLEASRTAKVPCIWIRCAYNTGPNHYLSEVWLEQAKRRRNGAYVSYPVCEPGEWNGDFFQVRPHPNEVIVTKHRYGAFEGNRPRLGASVTPHPHGHYDRGCHQCVRRDHGTPSLPEGLLRRVHERLFRHFLAGGARRNSLQHRSVLRRGRHRRADHGVLACRRGAHTRRLSLRLPTAEAIGRACQRVGLPRMSAAVLRTALTMF